MKIRPVRAELFHAEGRTDGRTDGQTESQTDIMKVTVAFRSFANALEKGRNIGNLLKKLSSPLTYSQ